METESRLSDRIADSILSMITVEQRFLPGSKLPNENVLSEELNVSRTTLLPGASWKSAGGAVRLSEKILCLGAWRGCLP